MPIGCSVDEMKDGKRVDGAIGSQLVDARSVEVFNIFYRKINELTKKGKQPSKAFSIVPARELSHSRKDCMKEGRSNQREDTRETAQACCDR